MLISQQPGPFIPLAQMFGATAGLLLEHWIDAEVCLLSLEMRWMVSWRGPFFVCLTGHWLTI